MISIVVCLVASLLYSLLFVFSLRGKRRINRIFSAYLLGMGLWTSTSVMWFADFPVLGDLPWLQMGMFFSIIAWMLMCLLSVVILGLDSVPAVRAGLWVIYGLGGLLLIGDLGGQLIHVTRIVRGHFDVQFGGLIYLFFALAGLSGVAFAFSFARTGTKMDDHNQRNRLLYLAISNVLIIIGGLANISPQLRPFPFDVLFDVVAALLMAYAIYRYQLLDLTLVVRKGLLYFVPTAIIGILYFVIIFFTVQVLHAFLGYQIFLLAFLIAVVTAVVAQPLRERAQARVDRLFFREKYDAYLMLQRLGRTAASVLDLHRLTGMILDEVTTTMHIESAAFFLKQKASGEFRLAAQRGLDQSADLRLGEDHPIVDWLSGHEHALTRHDVEVMPQFKALWGQEREELERMGAELFIPLKAKGELVGILTVGPKLSEAAYSEDDQLTLITLANQTAVAIKNAQLYEETRQRAMELNILYDVATAAAASIRLDETLNRAMAALQETLRPDNIAILLVEPEANELVIHAHTGFPGGPKLMRRAIAVGIPRWVVQTGQPVLLADVRQDERYRACDPDTHSELCVPLRVGERIIGAVNLESRRLRAFSEEDLRLVSTLAGNLATVIENARLYEEVQQQLAERKRAQEELRHTAENLRKTLGATIQAMAFTVETRDPYTAGHQRQVANLARAIGTEMGLSKEQIEGIRMAAVIHDMGKITVPTDILNKPGRLNEHEFGIIKAHPEVAYNILKTIEFPWPIAQIIFQHHERMDGSGYPQGLSGEEIILEARILAVADVVEAMASHRPYRPALGIDKALEEISQNRGVLFDPETVDVCLKLFTEKGFKFE